MFNVTIEEIQAESEETQELIQKLDDFLYEAYKHLLDEVDYGMDQYLDHWTVLAKPNVVFIGARDVEGTLVGMGAIKNLEDYSELKRIYVEPWFRGTGVAGMILLELESRSKQSVIRLETGTEQPAAVKFFWEYGYKERGPYGDYPDHHASIFMEKIVCHEDN